MAASRIDSAVTSLGCAVSPPRVARFEGGKGEKQSRTVVVDGNHHRSNVTSRFSTVVSLVRARWGGRCSRDYDTRERGRSANGDIVSALDTPLWGLATEVNVVVEKNPLRWLLPEFSGIDKIFHERSRLSWVANWLCVSMNRRQAIVSDGSMLAIDSVGEGLVTSFLAIVDLRSTR